MHYVSFNIHGTFILGTVPTVLCYAMFTHFSSQQYYEVDSIIISEGKKPESSKG